MSRSSSVASEALELPPPVWEVIQQFCPSKEALEVKRILGDSIIEEAGDLHSEVH